MSKQLGKINSSKGVRKDNINNRINPKIMNEKPLVENQKKKIYKNSFINTLSTSPDVIDKKILRKKFAGSVLGLIEVPEIKMKEKSSNKENSIHKRNKSVNLLSSKNNAAKNYNMKVQYNIKENSPKTSVIDNIQNVTYPQLENNNDAVFSYLQDALKTIDKITINFQTSAENNKLNPRDFEMDSFIKNIKEKQIDLISYNGHSLYYPNYNQLTENEMQNIQNQLIENSDKRTETYSRLFSHISTSLTDIQDYLVLYRDLSTKEYNDFTLSQDVQNQTKKEHNKKSTYYRNENNSFSMNEQGFDKIKNQLDMDSIKEKGENIEIINENDFEEEDFDNACDFNEASMLENALVFPPKLTNVNHLNSLQIKQLIRKETKKSRFQTLKQKNKNNKMELIIKNEEQISNSARNHRINHIMKDDTQDHFPTKSDTLIEFDSLFMNYENNIKNIIEKENDVKNNSTNFTTNENTSANVCSKHENIDRSNDSKCLIY